MAMAKTYTGGCHCGSVRFDVNAALDEVISCNCSICTKRGALWAFVPAQEFALRAGEDDLSDYQFNRKVIHHLFCRHCGVGSFSRGLGPDGRDMVAVNVRCLDDVDLDALTVKPFNGRNV